MKLKAFFLASACICLLSANVFAQNEDAFSIGPRLGVNFANVSNVDDSKASMGLVFGITSTYSLSESAGVTVDLLYSQEGYKEADDDELSLDYLRIPIYFDIFFGDLGEAFRPKVYVGVAPGILLKAETDTGVDLKDVSNSFVVDLSGGLGFNYRLAERVWLNVDARSFIGLSDVRDENFRVGDKVANRNVQISVGAAFGL